MVNRAARSERTWGVIRTLFMLILLFVLPPVHGQLCTGSLGDPVVHIDFGTPASPSTGFTAPGYSYSASSCPNDGFYTVTNFSTGCFGNAWHTVAADHTGGGNYMLVNASYQPGDFFVTMVTNLCPNTTYEFSAWIMNVLLSPSGIKPDITFRIETTAGTILNQYSTGGISVTSSPRWDQYGFYFTTTPGNSDVVIRMTNNAPGGGGNDLALDDIMFRPCGPVVSSAIQGVSLPVNVCVYDQQPYLFTGAVSPGFINPVFQWQQSADSGRTWTDIAGANSLTYLRQPSLAGRFRYRLSVAESGNAGISSCRIASEQLEVNIHPRPLVDAGPDKIRVAGYSDTRLSGVVSGENVQYHWTPPVYISSDTALQPLVTPPGDMQYLLNAVSEAGCTNEDAVNVKVVAGVFVPSAFTPNNDGKNDHWTIPFLDPAWGARVMVFNRAGQVVYQAKGVAVDWNGHYKGMPLDGGTFVYYIQFGDGKPDLKGTVTLIR